MQIIQVNNPTYIWYPTYISFFLALCSRKSSLYFNTNILNSNKSTPQITMILFRPARTTSSDCSYSHSIIIYTVHPAALRWFLQIYFGRFSQAVCVGWFSIQLGVRKMVIGGFFVFFFCYKKKVFFLKRFATKKFLCVESIVCLIYYFLSLIYHDKQCSFLVSCK